MKGIHNANVIRTMLVISLLCACAESEVDSSADAVANTPQTPDAEACYHAVSGPYFELSASSDIDDAPFASNTPHTWITVTLPESGDARTGVLAYTTEESGEVSFYLDTDAAIRVTTADGTTVENKDAAAVPVCREVVKRHTIELASGTYYITIGPTNAAEIGFAFERTTDEHGHSEGHGH